MNLGESDDEEEGSGVCLRCELRHEGTGFQRAGLSAPLRVPPASRVPRVGNEGTG